MMASNSLMVRHALLKNGSPIEKVNTGSIPVWRHIFFSRTSITRLLKKKACTQTFVCVCVHTQSPSKNVSSVQERKILSFALLSNCDNTVYCSTIFS